MIHTKSAHVDTFAAQSLPPREQWPAFVYNRPELQALPERINIATHLLDRWVDEGQGARRALLASGVRWTYAALHAKANRIAGVLTRQLGVVPGNRVLLRGFNGPMMAAAWLGVMKAGAIVVATMPQLRSGELGYVLGKAHIALALCDERLRDDLEMARADSPSLRRIAYFSSAAPDGLEAMMRSEADEFRSVDTAADDVCLIAFTSGTTGGPKGTMHSHRDLIASSLTYGAHVLRPAPDDLFCGSPPLAFTYGLGGLLVYPLFFGAATLLVEKPAPDLLLQAIAEHGATVLFTAPPAYRAMLALLEMYPVPTLRKCVSAGEALPLSTWTRWFEKTGIKILDGIGSTEMFHIFLGSPEEAIRPGATGKAVPGYQGIILDDDGKELAAGEVGRLAVRGPTGCRYIADARQTTYVQNGWNMTGDAYHVDAEGYFWYHARTDDMIVASGYNISGPEVEEVLLAHADVQECAVVASPDRERETNIVKAYVVLADPAGASAIKVRELQDFVKSRIAAYKAPRAIEFATELPRTGTGKLQRFKLRQIEAERPGST